MRGTYVAVGALVLAGVAILAGAVLLLSGNPVRHGASYETYFTDSVQGLDVGAPVKFRGVAIGVVSEIALTSASYGRGQPDVVRRARYRAVLVRFQIDTDRVGEPPGATGVALGLRARIAPQGLTGVSYVELDYFDPARYPPMDVPWTPRDPYIPSVPSTLSLVQDAATVLLNKMRTVDIDGLATGFLQLTHDVHAELDGGDAHTLMVQATGTLHALELALDQADVPALSAQLQQTLTAVRALSQGPQTKELLRSATLAVQRLTQATAQLPQLLASLDAVTRRADAGSADLEASLAPLLRDARTTVAALRETSEALRRDPSQVLLGGPPPRTR